MKEIQLIPNKVALVDDEDYEYLNQWKWRTRKCGYTYYAVCKGVVFMHREIMYISKGIIIDHKDRNGLNNQRENLKIVTRSENSKLPLKITHSGYPGVESIKPGEWIATINLDGKKVDLGVFPTEEEAYEEVKAMDKAQEYLFWKRVEKERKDKLCSRI